VKVNERSGRTNPTRVAITIEVAALRPHYYVVRAPVRVFERPDGNPPAAALQSTVKIGRNQTGRHDRELEFMIFSGLLDLTGWQLFWVTLALTHVTIASVTIFLHRHQAHRALELHPAVSHFFRLWLWLTTGMVTREWAAIHRKHHARCEREGDPHSPKLEGISRVVFGGALLYRREAMNAETMEAYGHGTPNDWLERNVYSVYRFSGVGVMLLTDLLLFGAAGAIVWIVQMLWIPFWAAGVINGIGHFWGYRNFETEDASRNIVPWGILIGGEELHNNHHAYGVSARLSNKWWEFDIGWLYIRALEIAGLAKVKRTAPKTSFADEFGSIDMELLKAIVANRFHVLKLYGSRVVRPVLADQSRDAVASGRHGLKTIRRLLVSEAGSDDSSSEAAALGEILDGNPTLRTIYEFKQSLKAIWSERARDQAEILARLQAWCADAEASGISALKDFATQLRGYRSRLAYA
jgi:stearoyl-CoA desaturase (delta-9 desaturase)